MSYLPSYYGDADYGGRCGYPLNPRNAGPYKPKYDANLYACFAGTFKRDPYPSSTPKLARDG